MYHVALDLTQEQKRQLKLLTYQRGQSVKDFITELVIKSLEKKPNKKEENAS